MKEFKYVKNKSGYDSTYFRLRGDMYWCDAGEWGVSFKIGPSTYDAIDFKEVHNIRAISHMSGIDGMRLTPVSEEEWADATGKYIPKGYEFQDNSIHCDDINDYDCFEEEEEENKENYMFLLIK